MLPRQRTFLASTLVGFGLLALLFKFAVVPINERPAKQREEQKAQRDQQSQDARQRELARLADVTKRARTQWHEDVVAAGATGPNGSIPPLVLARRNDAGEFVITNISGEPICISVARVRDQQRCELGSHGRCQLMANGEEREFAAPSSEGACRNSPLEFRIGNEVTTDLPWWSQSALEDFDRVTALLDEEFARARAGNGFGASDNFSNGQLASEAKAAEGYLAVEGIAERWAATLRPLRQIQLDRMVVEQSGGGGEAANPTPP